MEMFYSPKIIAVRHGSDGNGKNKNRSLTEEGEKQAKLAGRKIIDSGFVKADIYASPKIRTETTSKIIYNLLQTESINGIITTSDLLYTSKAGRKSQYCIQSKIDLLMEMQSENVPILVTHQKFVETLITSICKIDKYDMIGIPAVKHGQVVIFNRDTSGDDYFSYTFL